MVLGKRVNVTQKILECVKDNPGIPWKECAKMVAEEYNLDVANVVNLINQMPYAKGNLAQARSNLYDSR